MNSLMDTSRHPCFNAAVKGECGRVHLPVAANCNIKCNYCNRKYDCVNESRPGVTSAVLSPLQASRYMARILEKEPRITVAGIAGPGDPFANPEETLETIRLVRKKFPKILLCLATNGLGLPGHLDEIARLHVSHVTVTVNAVDPEIGAKIYSWVRDRKVIYRGIDGARLLLERQIESIRGLKERGVTIKVNTIIVPTINDHHVEDVARTMAELGVDVLNCMPMYPNRDTAFENLGEPGRKLMEDIREKAERHLPQMRHCTRCRADAAGLLEKDRGKELLGSFLCGSKEKNRPHVAVATLEGMLVNMHLGETHKFQIWTKTETGFACIEERDSPEPGGGPSRWRDLAEILHDCRAVLVSGIGDTPRKILSSRGIQPIEMNGFIAMGLDAVYGGGRLEALKARRAGCCKSQGCGGDGEGC
ncbi:MAG: radical SAM protein [Syntrophobacteraceae bacterium]